MSGKHINIDILPSDVGKPRVDFKEDDIDVLISQKGLSVIHESALACPCKPEGGSPLTSCKNCGGSGFIFINPIKTAMVVQSMNSKKKRWADWSEEQSGTVMVTSRNDVRLAYMDRLTVLGSKSLYSQVVYIQTFGDKQFGYLVYTPTKIKEVFLFVGQNRKLKLLTAEEYAITGNTIILKSNLVTDRQRLKLSVRYFHEVQYLVTDIGHDIRNSIVKHKGISKSAMLPVSATAQRVHNVMDGDDITGASNLFDNSYIFDDNNVCKTIDNDSC